MPAKKPRFPIGQYSGEERLDTAAMPEPDRDDDDVQDAWFEDERNEPEFKDFVTNRIGYYKDKMKLDLKALDLIYVFHSHIDVCWLWRYEQTRKKAAVTFRKACRMGTKYYPGLYKFQGSEPQLFDWIQQDDPELFKLIQEQVKAGTFNLVGGSWVEPDCMMPSGEAFVHQRLYGMWYYQHNFGTMPDIEWMEDSFGYGRNLPQIFAKSGAKYFFTMKLTWNKETTFPFVNFWFQSPDGSRVLAHECHQGFGTLDNFYRYEVGRHLLKEGTTYIGDYTRDYDDLADAVDDDALNKTIGFWYGSGDGGHGPTSQEVAEMLEAQAQGVGHVGTAAELYAKLAKDSARYPVWNDEMFLEYHQGTFTTHSRVKRNNRRLECKAVSVEALCALVVAQLEGAEYPKAEIDEAWKMILKNQFHDALPGSSIPEAYDDLYEDWVTCDELLDKCVAGVGKAIAPRAQAKNEFLVFNPNASGETRLFVPASTFDGIPLDEDGRPPAGILKASKGGAVAPLQPVAAEPAGWLEARPAGWWTVAPLTGAGIDSFVADFSDKAAIDQAFSGGIDVSCGESSKIDNGVVQVFLDRQGQIVKVSTALVPGVPNVFKGTSFMPMAFVDDIPNDQAWNITPGYNNHPRKYRGDDNPRASITKKGPVVSEVTVIREWGPQLIMTKVALFKGLPEVYCEFFTDWNDPRTLVKLAFDTAVTDARVVESDNQYCIITRSARPQTPADRARWEKIQHKFSDLVAGDGKWGVAFINDGKYAFDVMDPSVFRLTTLKSAEYPNAARESFARPERKDNMEKRGRTQPGFTDIGPHRTRFAIYPHAGATRADVAGKPSTDVVQRADMFNSLPIVIKPSGTAGAVATGRALVSSDSPQVLVKAVKKGHVDGKLFVVRLVEYTGNPAEATVLLDPAIAGNVVNVAETDLLERPLATKVTWDAVAGAARVSLGKWEIKTLAFTLK
ncbi:MAG: alpha-mannosidase [Candidatus Lokiarchaeota archaeon]|nr:alpha-mannosidase [Candidatus Lokiarchaeota archaeon]